MKPERFKRQTLALFFIISLIPALVVAAIWYLNTENGTTSLLFDLKSFVLPVMLLGVLPAMGLSYMFAELLSRPVERIHTAVLELAQGHFGSHFETSGAGEFQEIGRALDYVAAQLKQTLSETNSETAIIVSERNKLRGVLNSMTDGVFALDGDGRIILFNQAASLITGRNIESVAGQLAEKVMPFRQDGQLVMARWLATHRGTEHKTGIWKGLELYRADGTSLYVNVRAVVLPEDPNGIRALITFHDITSGQQLEQMKLDFVALAAHELRTPLTEVRGYLDLLQHEAKGLNKDNREFLEAGVESAGQLAGLINNILNVSRIEHGELNYRPEPTDYLDLINEMSKELTARVGRQNRQFELELPMQLPEIAIDRIGIREVINNLVNNAIDHTPNKNGRITLKVRRYREQIETSVEDNGSGIPTSAQSRLFTKFYRVDENSTQTRGTGLGLYICKSIVEAHGGHIWVDSTEGRGSTFSFRLPLHPVAPELPTSNNSNDRITRGSHGWIKEHSVR